MLLKKRYLELHPDERAGLYRKLAEAQGGKVTDLSVAENVLIVGEMLERLRAAALTPRHTKYFPAQGDDALRAGVASFLNESFGLSDPWRISPDHVAGFAGVSPALEWLLTAIRDLGPAGRQIPVLMPAPYWQGFKWCFENRRIGRIVPIDLVPDAAGRWPRLTLAAVQAAYAGSAEPPKALVLTNPHNPLGTQYDPGVLAAVFEWVLARTDMHIISDEIYAHSQLGGSPPFQSALANVAYRSQAGSQRIHLVWGFAKDFGLSGFRSGVAITRNEAVRSALVAGRMCFQSSFDSLKHLMIGRVLADGWARRAMETYVPRLRAQHAAVRDALNGHGIPFHTDVQGALFFWLDLRAYLDRKPPVVAASAVDDVAFAHPEIGDPREERLDNWLRRAIPEVKDGVGLLAGGILSSKQPGWFRLCFTCEPFRSTDPDARPIETALRDLKRALDLMVAT